MLRRIITLGLIGTCLCQYAQEQQQEEQYYNKDGGYHRVPPQILSHKQSQNHDGQFKYAFATENGLLQGESVSPDGSRTGAYAYVDPTGRKISVKYIAGKEGFKILEGDHIPKPPPQLAVNPHPGYQSYGPPDDGSYRPELPKPAYPPIKGAFTQFKPELPKPIYTPPKAAVPKGALFQQFRAGPELGPQLFNKPSFGNSFIPEKANEVQQYVAPSYRPEDREPDYADEPGKANSFGAGYAFEFGG